MEKFELPSPAVAETNGHPVKEQGTCALIRGAVASPRGALVAGCASPPRPAPPVPRPSRRVGPVDPVSSPADAGPTSAPSIAPAWVSGQRVQATFFDRHRASLPFQERGVRAPLTTTYTPHRSPAPRRSCSATHHSRDKPPEDRGPRVRRIFPWGWP